MELLKGFSSCVDFPASPMTLELFKLNPEAKVILGIRYLWPMRHGPCLMAAWAMPNGSFL